MKTTTVHARVSPGVKGGAEKVLEKMGLSLSQAISLFLNQVALHKGMPFELNLPNKETRKALADSVNRRNLKTYKSVDDLMDKFL